jgi:dolichyl-phosphate-mannose-protein mannosyltransferase
VRVSAPAHTRTPSEEPVAAGARLVAVLDRALPYLGPALAGVLGLVALGRRAFVVDEASLVAAVQGSFSDVVERAISNDPAKAGYLALLQPVASASDSELWLRLPSVVGGVVAAIAAYRLGRRLAGRHAGAAASLVLASSVGVVSLTRSVGPLALALAAMLVSSAVFARAMEHGNAFWWVAYAASALSLPLTHPITVSALAAHLAAAGFAWRELDLPLAVPALAVAVVECGLLLVAAAVDRADAPDAAGPLEPGDVVAGIGRAIGWNPVVPVLAVWGVIVLTRRSVPGGRWRPVLVAGLAVMPLVFVVAAGLALPVFPRVALTVAAGGLALGAGIGLVAIPDRGIRLTAGAALAVVAVAALGTAAARDQRENWRAAAHVVLASRRPEDTVVVLPERARAAFSYYAPGLRLSRIGRGDAVFVVVAGDPRQATASGRQAVSPPRYALLSEAHAGEGLVVQRWVRP